MRCTPQGRILPSATGSMCFAASAGTLRITLATTLVSALGVVQAHDTVICASYFRTMTTSITTLAGRRRGIIHMVETIYQTTTSGQTSDDLSNVETLRISTPLQKPTAASPIRNKSERRTAIIIFYFESTTLHTLPVAITVVILAFPCRSRLRLVFINKLFAVCFIIIPRHGYCHSSHETYSF
jgi:hypothetical protein